MGNKEFERKTKEKSLCSALVHNMQISCIIGDDVFSFYSDILKDIIPTTENAKKVQEMLKELKKG